jgi:hypothetical protein
MKHLTDLTTLFVTCWYVCSSSNASDDLDPVLTLDGFCHLIVAIEGEIQRIPRKLKTEQLYSLTGSLPQEGVVLEIIEYVPVLLDEFFDILVVESV